MDAVLLTLLQGLVFLILLPLLFVPGLWFLPPALFAGMDYSDLNLVRRGYATRERPASGGTTHGVSWVTGSRSAS